MVIPPSRWWRGTSGPWSPVPLFPRFRSAKRVPGWVSPSNQLFDGIAVLEHVLRAAVVVGDRGRGIDPEDAVERRQDVLRSVRAGRGGIAGRAGRPDALPHLEPPAGEEHAARRRPVVAAAELVDPRRASDLPPRDDAHVLV